MNAKNTIITARITVSQETLAELLRDKAGVENQIAQKTQDLDLINLDIDLVKVRIRRLEAEKTIDKTP